MNLLDESLLTAYLDDELDPDDRAAIETALLAQPPLAQRLRELSQVREAIQSARRPELGFDAADAIVARLRLDRDQAAAAQSQGQGDGHALAGARILRFFESSKLNRFAVWAAAALLLVAAGFWQLPRPAQRDDHNPNLVATDRQPDSGGSAILSIPKSEVKAAPAVALKSGADVKAQPNPCEEPAATAIANATNPASPPAASPHEQELKRWLQNPQSRVLSANFADPTGADVKRVEHSLSETSLNACRFAVIVDESAKSTVIAVQIQGEEWNRIRQTLDQAFPKRFQEVPVQPRIIALAQGRPARFVDIVAPRDSVIKPPTSGQQSVLVIQHPVESAASAKINPFDEPVSSEPAAVAPAPNPASASADSSKKVQRSSSEPTTVLIILTADPKR